MMTIGKSNAPHGDAAAQRLSSLKLQSGCHFLFDSLAEYADDSIFIDCAGDDRRARRAPRRATTGAASSVHLIDAVLQFCIVEDRGDRIVFIQKRNRAVIGE